jgi:hypothetical protein
MEHMVADKKQLKSFSAVMCVAFALIAAILWSKHKPAYVIFSATAFTIALLGLFWVLPLRPFYYFWMGLARTLSWINTRLILVIVFYLIFTPLALVLKLLGKDLLDLKTKPERDSYWLKKAKKKFNLQDYERQF